MTGGGVRFWYNVWHDLPQLGGGSEQGLLNPNIMPPQWETLLGDSFELSNLWMQLFGVDAILVNEKNSYTKSFRLRQDATPLLERK